jgi:mono/diheme cytochrome c family protein
MMKRIPRVVIFVAAPLLMAALWMDRQPSYKPYQAPVLTPPAGSVPVSGREIIPEEGELRNPVAATPTSLAQGKALFEINCAICHGQSPAEPGPVGMKLKPPPPGLNHEMVGDLSDSAIFRAVTFGFGRMPPFQDKLTPRERWNLVNFLRTRK